MLLFVPTAREVEGLRPPSGTRLVVLGLGPVEAGIAAAEALSTAPPGPCLLVGVAGTYDESRLPVGGVLWATEARLEGVGREPGAVVRPPATVLPEDLGGRSALPIPLGSADDAPAGTTPGALLTVAASSGSPSDAAARRAAHPDALAEDMEAWAVARACLRAGRSLGVLRGISNLAGDPDHRRWRLDEALGAAGEVLRRAIG
jgi:futalosine hydrolase